MTIALALQLVGLVLEITGATLIGSSYVSRVRLRRVPAILLAALIRSANARAYVTVAPRDGDGAADAMNGLQGVALLWLGFVLQLGGGISQWLSA